MENVIAKYSEVRAVALYSSKRSTIINLFIFCNILIKSIRVALEA